MVVDSIDKVGVDCVQQVLDGFKVRDLLESQSIVVKEFQPSSRPSLELGDLYSNGLGVNASKVDGSHIYGN